MAIQLAMVYEANSYFFKKVFGGGARGSRTSNTIAPCPDGLAI